MLSPVVQDAIKDIQPLLDAAVAAAVDRRWRALRCPAGALGRFQELVTHYQIIQNSPEGILRRKALFVFCADHGITEEKAGPLTRDTSAALASDFLRGDAPGSVLCRHYGIELSAIDAGLHGPVVPGALPHRVMDGAFNFTRAAAMSPDQTNAALETGMALAADAAQRFDVAGIAFVGAGAAVSAAAVFAALMGRDPADTTLRSAGLADAIHAAQLSVIRAGLARRNQSFVSPFGVLAGVGGPDIAMAAGFLLGAALQRLPVIIDCFTGAAAALVARGFCADSLDAAIFAHDSGDPAHRNLFAALDVVPQVNLGLGAAPGCGAAVVVNMLDAGIRLFNEVGEE